jgi:hypothetical protein
MIKYKRFKDPDDRLLIVKILDSFISIFIPIGITFQLGFLVYLIIRLIIDAIKK